MPKNTSAFAVAPQIAQENQAPYSYSTEPSFFVPGTKAADIQSKRKKTTLEPLTPLLNANQRPENYSSASPLMYSGLMTPQTPSSEVAYPTYSHGHHTATYYDTSSDIRSNIHRNRYYSQSSRPFLGFDPGLLLTAPTTSYPDPFVPSSAFSSPRDYSNEERPPYSPFPSSDFDDHDTICDDLSPLLLKRHANLPPDFIDQPGTDAVPEAHNLQLKEAQKMKRKPVSKLETVVSVHKILQDASLTPTHFLIHILQAAHEGTTNARLGEAFFRQTNVVNIHRLLDLILANHEGASILKEWMRPHAMDLICGTIHKEMENAKPFLRMSTAEATPDFIESWDINGIMDPVSENITPTWSTVLKAACDPKFSPAQSEEDEEDNCQNTTRNIISAQVHYRRSVKSAKVQIGLGLMAWSTGASQNLLGVLHKAGLSMSYRSITATVDSLQKFSLEEAAKISHGAHACSYDNVNFSTSDRLEQRPDAMSKVQTGTFPVLYALDGVSLQHMKLAPLLENLRKSQLLQICDLRPTQNSARMYRHQTAVNIGKILFKHSNLFDGIAGDPLLQNQPRRPRLKNQKTRFFPLSVSTIEEASIDGNLHVHNNIYIEQLRRDPSQLEEYAIPSLNDQLTNARIRSAQSLRSKDVNSWERREVFQLAFGTFHLVMNLTWALLHKHRGTVKEIGSLSYYFSLLEKARLGNDRPEYYPLRAALIQILEGLILNAWISECGHVSLELFAASKPTPEKILEIARIIIAKYATPRDFVEPTEVPPKKRQAGASNELIEPDQSRSGTDYVHCNAVLLTRDLLYVVELIDATSAGDFGRIEDVLPSIACIFRGAGSNNYSTEILHFLFNIKHVWTEDFANVMRDIMLVNPSGHDGHSMAIDMNIEHLIGYLKGIFAAKGLYSNWDRLSKISAATNYLQLIKKRVVASLNSGYQGSTHKDPDTSALVKRVANRVRELKIQETVINREAKSKPVLDLHYTGFRKFETSSLAMFNKKIAEYKIGREVETIEVDDLPRVEYQPEEVELVPLA